MVFVILVIIMQGAERLANNVLHQHMPVEAVQVSADSVVVVVVVVVVLVELLLRIQGAGVAEVAVVLPRRVLLEAVAVVE
jgi:hypothetical protein